MHRAFGNKTRGSNLKLIGKLIIKRKIYDFVCEWNIETI